MDRGRIDQHLFSVFYGDVAQFIVWILTIITICVYAILFFFLIAYFTNRSLNWAYRHVRRLD